MSTTYRAIRRQSGPLTLAFAAAVAVGCASSGRTTTTSGGDVSPTGARAVDTTGRVVPATGSISPTAAPPALGAGVTGAPQPGTPAVATPDAGAPGAGAGAGAAAAAGVNAAAAMGAMTEANVAALLHESNLGEIRESNLAQQKASSAAVRSYAAQMVAEHTALDQKGTAIAQSESIVLALPNTTLQQQNQADVATLEGQSGAAFDRAYIAQQIAAHQRVLAMIDASSSIVKSSALRAALQDEVRPRVAEHLRMAQQLQTQVGSAP